jgi:molybdopterin-containing oxidoreductase family iron-sulfur binding subunit
MEARTPLDAGKRRTKDDMSVGPLDLNAIRERLEQAGGPQYWRSLESVAETPEFQEFLHREFPANASEWTDPVGRRSFLKLMSASMALAGVSACTVQPTELIVPYVRQPEEEVPGKPLFFATAMTLGGIATGVLAESHAGRPTKVEGNPDHPGSLGATDLYAQASVLTLYDPDRSQSIVQLGEIRPWTTFVTAMKSALQGQGASKGAGLRILTETVSSPTLAAQIQQVLAAYPEAKWIQWEALPRDQARAGSRLAFGEVVEPQYDFTRADVVVSLDADFLASEGPANLRYTRQFSSRRRIEGTGETMSRVYVIEATPSVTGAKSDHRVPLKSGQIDGFARALAARVGVAGVSGGAPAGTEAALDAIAKDLAAHRGRSIVIAGDAQPASVHALTHAMNAALGNAGGTVTYTAAPEAVPSQQLADLRALVSDMDAGRVQLLLMIGESNPVLTAPADLKFADAMAKVPMRAHSGLFLDETATLSHWHVPGTHYLEAWSDARTIDGTVTIVQPLIQPMYGGKSAHEVVGTLSETPDRSGYDLVRDFWSRQPQGSTDPAAFEKAWRGWLHDGLIPGTAHAAKAMTVAGNLASALPAPPAVSGLEVNFRRDATVHDGRFANNGWLQEMPKPMTKLTWDNAALIAPSLAQALGVESGDIVEVRHEGRLLRVPVWITPGHAGESLTIAVGYGRTRAGRVGNGTGFNAYALQGSTTPFFGAAEASATGDDYPLVSTQDHWTLEGRNVLRSAHLEEFKANPSFAHEMEHLKLDQGITLMPTFEYTGNRWGMAIDLNACTGCGACMVACVAENNIPVVGKEQVSRNREMHWLRVDRYYAGSLDNPDVYFQPLPCQQCENAPCEVVCPVAATVHSAEGLNDMVYNRCVGTRYCSNNCPYKVRRFNFLLFQDWDTPQFKLQRNPDVTVRSRGVMEKCTYCVQRINAARIQSKREEREIRDGEVLTACQAVCPAEAIVFGNMNDPNSRVAKLKQSPLNYSMLAELNTNPRTTYLAAVRNPNPDTTALPRNPTVGGHHATTGHDTASEH